MATLFGMPVLYFFIIILFDIRGAFILISSSFPANKLFLIKALGLLNTVENIGDKKTGVNVSLLKLTKIYKSKYND